LAVSQIGGDTGYQVLNLSKSARSAGLAGTTISIADGDISQFYENPAILDSIKQADVFFNVNPYFADAVVFSVAYAFELKKAGTFAIGLNYLDYGSFDFTDATGNSAGTFGSQDYIFSVGKAHKLGPITLGGNIKLLHSSIDTYSSTAVLGDIGGIFRVNDTWTMGMVFSNIGARISQFNDLSITEIPFDVKIGTTFKPQYMPLRFTLTSNNLTQKNEVKEVDEEGRSNVELEKILRRINFGVELLLSDNFQLLFGYNHKRKQELKLEDLGGGAGLSFGLLLTIKRIQLRYSRAIFHAAGGSSFISLQTNLNNFRSIL
jgi:hypothetical protein